MIMCITFIIIIERQWLNFWTVEHDKINKMSPKLLCTNSESLTYYATDAVWPQSLTSVTVITMVNQFLYAYTYTLQWKKVWYTHMPVHVLPQHSAFVMDSLNSGSTLTPGSILAVKNIETFLQTAEPTMTIKPLPYKVIGLVYILCITYHESEWMLIILYAY